MKIANTIIIACLALGLAACGSASAKSSIIVVSREDGSGTRGSFTELFGVEVKGDGTKKDMTTKEAEVVNKTDVMLTNIAGNPNAIGYVSLGSLNGSVKTLAIDGAEPSPVNIKNGTYKISRPFNIVVKGNPSEPAADFIKFILSEEGQSIVSGGYIAVGDRATAYDGTKPSGKIVVAGSSSVTPVMEKLAEGYMALNPSVTVEIQMSDSTSGVTGTIESTCDIGMVSRDLTDVERETLTCIPIALDGIAVIVNIDNRVSGATTEQIRGIFTGEIIDWSEVSSQ